MFLNEAKHFKLIYLFSSNPNTFYDQRIQLVDVKITYRKHLANSAEVPYDISQYFGEMDHKLHKLAIGSGCYSRFRLDERLVAQEFEKLYSIWIENAWISKSVMAAPDLQGMVTYSVEGGVGSVELLAVTKEYQSQGWGKKLMKGVEGYLVNRGVNQLKVITQQANKSANNLYESLGYEKMKIEFVYHYWRDE